MNNKQLLDNNELTKIRSLYENLLCDNALEEYKEKTYPFFMQYGKRYFNTEKRILFVGKATNGWATDSHDIEILFGDKMVNGEDQRIVNCDDQMEWVEKADGTNTVYKNYNTNRSSFWRFIKSITKDSINSEDWFNSIAWTNLYKLAPEEGNPSEKLMNIQYKKCVEILNEEIKLLKPNYLIFLTSGWENSFIEKIKIKINNEFKLYDNYSLIFGEKDNKYYIQSFHPQGKTNTLLTDTKELILELINNEIT